MRENGVIPKDRSGHRNLLHLLRTILADPRIDALGRDYIPTPDGAKALVARKSNGDVFGF